MTSLAAQAFQNGVGVLARSGVRSRVLFTSNDGSGTAMVLSGTATVLTGAKTLGLGSLPGIGFLGCRLYR